MKSDLEEAAGHPTREEVEEDEDGKPLILCLHTWGKWFGNSK